LQRTAALLLAMAAAIACVGGLAWWDGARESSEALEDFGSAQATLAATVAVNLSTRLGLAQNRSELLDGLA
jgi:hypothetical protein